VPRCACAVVPFSYAFSRAHFVGGAIIRTSDDIVALAQTAGLDAGRFRETLADKETGALHGAHVARAQRAGAFGVPTFVVGDRLVLVRHALPQSAAKA
jgi:2-hydroxychromene-2-carboxylate isomerase